jgi:hypothetical protein
MKFLLALLAATAFADTGAEKTESQRNPTPTAAVRQSSAPKQGLNFVVALVVSIHSRLMENRFLSRRKGASCRRRNLFFVLCSTQFFLFVQQESRRRIKGPTPST